MVGRGRSRPPGCNLRGFWGSSSASRRPLAAPRTLLGSPAAGALLSGFTAKMGLGTAFLAPPDSSGIFWNFPPGACLGSQGFPVSGTSSALRTLAHLELGCACPGLLSASTCAAVPLCTCAELFPEPTQLSVERVYNACFSIIRFMTASRISVFCVLSLAPSEFLGI